MAKNAGSKTTTDHEEIRRWAEERDAKPSCVRGTGGKGDIGMLRLDFPGYSGETSLEHIGWDDWFEKFDERNLALLFQESTAGGQKSNFNKLVSRETAEESSGRSSSKPAASSKKAAGATRGSSARKKTTASAKSTKKTSAKTAAKTSAKASAKTPSKKSARRSSAAPASRGRK